MIRPPVCRHVELMTDQPATCPRCGHRTDMLATFRVPYSRTNECGALECCHACALTFASVPR